MVDFVFPAVSNFNENIRTELKNRFSRFGSDNRPHSFWIRFISNTKRVDKDDIRPNMWMLTAGTLTPEGTLRGGFQEIYNETTGRHFRPMPGITDISVETTGQYGSIRKATINWYCPSVKYLEELEPYFLRIGVSAMIDFGYGDISTISKSAAINIDERKRKELMVKFFKKPSILYNDYIIPSNGKYDAMVGRISNFSYTINEDGSYNCTTEVSAMGELILGINLKRQIGINEYPQTSKKRGGTLQEFLASNDFDRKCKDLHNNGEKRILIKDENIWVTWGFFEEIINKMVGMVPKGESPRELGVFRLDSSDILICNDKYLFSTDPDIILLGKSGPMGSVPAAKTFDTEFDPYSGYMTNIYVNTKEIKKSFSEAETFQEAAKNLLNRMSACVDNLWAFEFYADPKHDNVMQVIDTNYTNSWQGKDGDYITFNRYDGRGIIKDISLTTKISKEVAIKFFVGKNKSEEENDIVVNDVQDSGIKTLTYSSKGETYVDLVYADLVRDPEAAKLFESTGGMDTYKQVKESKDTKKKTENMTEEEISDFVEKSKTIHNVEGSSFYIVDQKKAAEIFAYIRRKTQKNARRHMIPLYFIEVEITLDGISGILPGNVFRIANIPTNYYNNGVFQVMSVTHKVDENNWDTTIKAVYRLHTFSDKELSSGDAPPPK